MADTIEDAFPSPDGFVDTRVHVEEPKVKVDDGNDTVTEKEPEVKVQDVTEQVTKESQVEIKPAEITEDEPAPEVKEAAPVITEDEEADTVEDKLPDHISLDTRLVNRVWGDSPNCIPRRIHSKALVKLLNDIDHDGQISLAPDIVLDGVFTHTKKETALWEEGGATENFGTVLLITGTKGEKLPAIVAFCNDRDGNGKHALVRVRLNDYVAMGVQRKLTDDEVVELICLYRITNIDDTRMMNVTKQGQTQNICVPAVSCTLVKTFAVDNQTENFGTEEEDKLFTSDHPVIRAALKQMYTKYAHDPVYVKQFRDHRFDYDDYRDAISDENYLKSIKYFDNLSEMYTDVIKTLIDKLPDLQAFEHPVIETVVDKSNEEGERKLLVFVSGVIYDTHTKSSKGNRLFYGRVVLNKDDKFYDVEATPDKGYDVSFILDQIDKMGNDRPKSAVMLLTRN